MRKNIEKTALILFSLVLSAALSAIFIVGCRDCTDHAEKRNAEAIVAMETECDQRMIEFKYDITEKQEEAYGWFSEIFDRSTVEMLDRHVMEELYDDIMSSETGWEKDVLSEYLHKIIRVGTGADYGIAEKKVMHFLQNKDNLFRRLMLYYAPVKNAGNLEDIDKDGIPFENDHYPLNYSNGEVYFILTRSVIGDQGPHHLTSTLAKTKNILVKRLNHDPDNIYSFDPTTKNDFLSALEEVLSKTNDNDIIFLDIGIHGDKDGMIWFNKSKTDHRKYESYHASNLNNFFQDKKYSHVIIVIGSCNGYAVQDAIHIDRSISIAESRGISYAFSDQVIHRQIEIFYDLSFHSFLNELNKKIPKNETRVIINGDINMPTDQKDWLIFPAYYKNY